MPRQERVIHFITGNANKFREAKQVIPELQQLDLDLPEIQSLDPREILQAKIDAARSHYAGAFIVEDVSFMLEALNGLPGPFIKWFLQALGAAGISNLVTKLGTDRTTVSILLGYVNANGAVSYFDGMVAGRIVTPRGDESFGFDPIFLPDGQEKTYGEMSAIEKQSISHRSIALMKLKKFLDPSIIAR